MRGLLGPLVLALSLLALLWPPKSTIKHEIVWGLIGFQGLSESHAFVSDLSKREDDPRRDKPRVAEQLPGDEGALTDGDGIAVTHAAAPGAHIELVDKESRDAVSTCALPGQDVLGTRVGLSTPRAVRSAQGLQVSAVGEARRVAGLWILPDGALYEVHNDGRGLWSVPASATWVLLSQADLSGWGSERVCAVRLQGANDEMRPRAPKPVVRARNFDQKAAPVLRARNIQRGIVAYLVLLAGVIHAGVVLREARRQRDRGAMPLAVALAAISVCGGLALIIWKG